MDIGNHQELIDKLKKQIEEANLKLMELTEQLDEFKDEMEKKTAALARAAAARKQPARTNSKYDKKNKILEKVETKLKEKVEEAIIEKSEHEKTQVEPTPEVKTEKTPEQTVELPAITPSRVSSRASSRTGRKIPDMSLHLEAERRFEENAILDSLQPPSRLMVAKKVRVDRKNYEFSDDRKHQESNKMGIVRKYVHNNIIKVEGTATGSDFYPHNFSNGGVSLNNFD